MKKNNKKAQVTIFIIIAVLIIAIVALLIYLLNKQEPNINPTPSENPKAFLENCLDDKIQEAVREISFSGGKLRNPLSLKFKFDNEPYYNISYLCYTGGYYGPCTMQSAMFIKQLREELKDYLKNDVERCYNELEISLGDKGYTVNSKYTDFDIELSPGKLAINYDSELILTKSKDVKTFSDFEVIKPTKIYNLAIVAQEIANQQARFCNFENLGFMLFYPEFDIEKFNIDESKIYTIKHRKTKEVFRIAIRSCAIPAGLF